ncbi:MAG: hypothetical protein K9M80_02325 [Candidatus Marinimicrobia bacterium]|nr:hypothetical protein [Candidatus Neomarinimicrobiota bacterium]
MRYTIKNNKYLFISWDGFDIRHKCYSEILDGKCQIIEKHYINRFRAFWAWFTKSFRTYHIIRKHNPKAIVTKNTHFVITLASIIIKILLNKKLILDSHSCSFENGIHYPQFLHRIFIQFADLSIVTNKKHKKIVKNWGGKTQIINFPPINYSNTKISNYPVSQGFNICYIQTFSSDEPYWEVVNAVTKLKNIKLYITGNPEKTKHALSKSEQIIHTGFLFRDKYLGLIQNSDIVIVLTTRENTMQRGANEAVFMEKPVITSNTSFLKKYFYKGCLHVDINTEDISKGIKEMKINYQKYKKDVRKLQNELYKKNTLSVLEIDKKLFNNRSY